MRVTDKPSGIPGPVRGSSTTGASKQTSTDGSKKVIWQAEVTKGDLVTPSLNKFFRWVNGYTPGEEKDETKHNYFSLRDLTKSVWVAYPLLQLVGLVNENIEKLARAWYGACWSIVYSCYRPWKENRDKLTNKNAPEKIPEAWQKIYLVNEHFRIIVGTVVSLIYGSGAFGMLWSWLNGNEDAYDRAYEVYKTGMFNQNQIFASMNADVVMRRNFNENQLSEADKEKTGVKAAVEYIDTALFIPNIITRTLDTFRLFGANLSEGLQRFVNFLGYFSYGTWASRFGIMKSNDEDGGDLNKELKNTNPSLYSTQRYSGIVFSTVLPVLSWISAIAELLGFREFAEKSFKLEGICERLNPTIASWCIANPWLQGYLKTIKPSLMLNISRSEP